MPPEQEGETENKPEEIVPPTEAEENDSQEENKMPTTLPKTGTNIYIPICIVLAILLGTIIVYNKKFSKK